MATLHCFNRFGCLGQMLMVELFGAILTHQFMQSKAASMDT
jgi:hypothetical protein